MKPEKKKLQQLTNNSGPYTVKVKVIDKTRPQTSPIKGKRYQSIMLQDDEGSTMRATLFDDDIEAYESVIKRNKEYDISNAPIRKVDERYQRKPNEFQMTFDNRTLIQPLNEKEEDNIIEYQNISSIPRTAISDDHFDMLGVVIYIEPLRQVTASNTNRQIDVREIVLTDNSSDQIIIVSAWNDLAINDCETLDSLVPTFPIVGLTTLKPTQHKGFLLSTTMSTLVLVDPKGEKVDLLKKWAASNAPLLKARKAQVEKVGNPSKERIITNFAELKAKKASNTLQEERHWLCVFIPALDKKDVRLYLGCNNCGKRSDCERDVFFKCSCNKIQCISTPRMNINFEATDHTGSYLFTAFTDEAEKILKTTATEFYDMKFEDRTIFLEKATIIRAAEPFYIQVAPATSLSRNRVLKWILKSVTVE